MAIEIVRYDFIKQEDLISLCANSTNSWFQHTNDWLNYTLAMRENGSDDLSFAIMENNKLVAFAPLIKA